MITGYKTNTENVQNYSRITKVTIQGTVIRLAFADEANREISAIVGEILKGAYIRQHAV